MMKKHTRTIIVIVFPHFYSCVLILYLLFLENITIMTHNISISIKRNYGTGEGTSVKYRSGEGRSWIVISKCRNCPFLYMVMVILSPTPLFSAM
jgi:hypothetical protein